jgi:hypothetical protein
VAGYELISYMVRALFAPIIRSVTTVYAAPWYEFHIVQPPSYVEGYEFISCHVGRWFSDVKLVPGAAYTVVTLLMMGAGSARNM